MRSGYGVADKERKVVELASPCEDLPKHYLKSIKFDVVHQRVMVRKTPSTRGEPLKMLPRGEVVNGYLQDKWLKIAGADSGWVLVDGSALGFGALLQPQEKMCELEMKGEFSNAAWLTWKKVPGRCVEYCIQWHLRSDPKNIHTSNQRETMCMARVHNLPHEEEIMLRVLAYILTDTRELGGEVLTTIEGEWVGVETDREITEMDESNLCCDPLANIRGRCMDCDCGGFVISNYGDNRPDQRLENILCRRCSCSCVRHLIIGEFRYARTGPRRDISKQIQDETSKALAAAKAIEMPAELIWGAEDAGDQDKVQFVLDKVAQARTLYETIGIATSADDKEIRSAYRHLSLVIHPDKVQTREDAELVQQAEGAFKIISSAYEILSDDVKRMAYNRSMRIRPSPSTAWSRSNLTSLSFIKRFLGKGGFGYDLKAKPPGDWEQDGVGMWRRSDRCHIVVTHAISGEKLTIHVDRGSPVSLLKKRMVEELKRGPASRIELLDMEGKEVKDSYLLQNSDNFETAGIQLGPPKEVSLCLIHADSGARIRIKVLDTSTMQEIRSAAGQRLGCKFGGEKIRLGARSKNQDAFLSFEDTEFLNGREQLLILGIDISHKLDLDEATELQRDLIKAYGADWFQKELGALLEQNPMPDALVNIVFRERFGELVKAAQADTLVKYGFDGKNGVFTMLSAFSEVGNSPEVKSLLIEIDKKLRVTHGGWLPAATTVTLEQALELTISVVMDRTLADWPIVLKVRKGVTIRDLKWYLCKSDPTGLIVPESFALCMSVDDCREPGQRLQDSTQLDESHSRLEVCDPAAPLSLCSSAEKVDPPCLTLTFPSKKCKFKEVRQHVALRLKVDIETVKLAIASSDALDFSYCSDDDYYSNQKVLQVLGAAFPVPGRDSAQSSKITKQPLEVAPKADGKFSFETSAKLDEKSTLEEQAKVSAPPQDLVNQKRKCDNCIEMKTMGRAGDAHSPYAHCWYCSDCWRLWEQADGKLDKFERQKAVSDKLEVARAREAKTPIPTIADTRPESGDNAQVPNTKYELLRGEDRQKSLARSTTVPKNFDKEPTGAANVRQVQIKCSANRRAGEKCEILANDVDDEDENEDEEVAFLLSRCVKVKFSDGQCEWFKTDEVEEVEVILPAPTCVGMEPSASQSNVPSDGKIQSEKSTNLEIVPKASLEPSRIGNQGAPTPIEVTSKASSEASMLGKVGPPSQVTPKAVSEPSRLGGEVVPTPSQITQKAAPEPARQISFDVQHVSAGDFVTLSLMSSSNMMTVKRALARKVGRPGILEFGKFVEDDSDGGYKSIANTEALGTGRSQLFFMNATLKENPDKDSIEENEYEDAEKRGLGMSVVAKAKDKKPEVQMLAITIRSLEYGQQVILKIPAHSTIADLKQNLAEFVGKPEVLTGKLLRRNADGDGYTSIKDDGELVGGRTNFTIMSADIHPAKGSPMWKEERAKARPAKAKARAATAEVLQMETKDPELVLLTITHATNTKEQPVEISIMDNLLVSDLKDALAKKLKRPEVVTKGRFVQKKGVSSFGAVRDSETIGSRKSFSFMGVDMKRGA